MVIFSRKPVPEKPFTVKHFKNLVLAGFKILYWPVTFEPHSAVSMKQYTVLMSFTLYNYNYLIFRPQLLLDF